MSAAATTDRVFEWFNTHHSNRISEERKIVGVSPETSSYSVHLLDGASAQSGGGDEPSNEDVCVLVRQPSVVQHRLLGTPRSSSFDFRKLLARGGRVIALPSEGHFVEAIAADDVMEMGWLFYTSTEGFCPADSFHPAHLAAEHGALKALQQLICWGVETVYSVNERGFTVLMEAVAHNRCECVLYLCKNYGRSATTVLGKDGWCALQIAARQGCVECFRILVLHGADPLKTRDKRSWTVLMTAAAADQADLVRFICNEYPSLLRVRTDDNLSALEIARAHQAHRSVALLTNFLTVKHSSELGLRATTFGGGLISFLYAIIWGLFRRWQQ